MILQADAIGSEQKPIDALMREIRSYSDFRSWIASRFAANVPGSQVVKDLEAAGFGDDATLAVKRYYYQAHTRVSPLGWAHRVLGATYWDKPLAEPTNLIAWLTEEGFSDDTIRFVRERKSRQSQRDLIEAVATRNMVTCRSSNAAGKTFTAATLVPWFLNIQRPGYVITSAASWKGLRKGLWPEIRRVREQAPIKAITMIGQANETEWKLGTQWEAFAISPTDPENFASFRTQHGVFVEVDEASALTDTIMEAIHGLCATEGSRILLIGNPLATDGPFYESFRKGRWTRLHLSALDSPNIVTGCNAIPGIATREWLLDRRDDWGEDSPMWQARVLGDFPEGGADNLIYLSWLEQSVARDTVDRSAGLRFGVDVARSPGTGDESVLAAVQGDQMVGLWTLATDDLMTVAGFVASKIDEMNPALVSIDVIGIGAGVVDVLLGQGRTNVQGVSFAQRAFQEDRYQNLRVESWWRAREWVKEKGKIVDDEKLKGDLGSIRRRGFTSTGQERLESKEELKKRLGRSPDRGDALALALCPKLPEPTKRHTVDLTALIPDILPDYERGLN